MLSKTEWPIWLTTCHVPVIIEGCQHRAVSDSQSSHNLISRDFVEQYNFTVSQKFQVFRMIDGTTQISTGFTWIRCGVKDNSTPVRNRLFYVFETLHVPLLIGRSFWEDSHSQDRLATFHISYTIRYPCIPLAFQRNGNIGELVLSAVDTGTSANLISLKFAREKQFPIKTQLSRQIRTPNGRLVSVVGTIKTKIQIGSIQGTPLCCRFLVVCGLAYDVGLGRNFLFKPENKQMISSYLTYITQSRECVLYGAIDKLSPIATIIVDWRCGSKDPADDKEVKGWEKELKQMEEKRESVQSELRDILLKLAEVPTKSSRQELLREWEKEWEAEKNNETIKPERIMVKGWLPGRDALKHLKAKWKKAKREEHRCEIEIKRLTLERDQKLEELRAADWEEKHEESENPIDEIAARKKALSERRKQKRQRNDHLNVYSDTPRHSGSFLR